MAAPKGLTAEQLQAQAAMTFQGKPPKKYWGERIDLATFQAIVKGTQPEADETEQEWVIDFCTQRGIPYYAGRKCIMCNGRLGEGWGDLEHPYHKDCLPTCMWCAKEFPSKEALEAHEDECLG
jgi:hypothetical protein